MSRFTPWTEEEMKTAMTDAYLREAEEASRCCEDCRAELANADRYFDAGFLAGAAWAAEQVKKSPTVYGIECESGFLEFSNDPDPGFDTHTAKLVGVREVEK